MEYSREREDFDRSLEPLSGGWIFAHPKVEHFLPLRRVEIQAAEVGNPMQIGSLEGFVDPTTVVVVVAAELMAQEQLVPDLGLVNPN